MGKDTGDEEALLDAKTMDGPTVNWAPNDVFKSNPKAFMTYHVMQSGYSYLTPVGVVLGGLITKTPLKKMAFPRMTPTQVSGTVGFAAGLAGMALGCTLMYRISTAEKPKLPWNDEGIQTRVDGLSHNFQVRTLDRGVTGAAVSTGGLMLAMGGPTSLGLSAGALGVAQGLALGSGLGSLGSVWYIAVNKKKIGNAKEAIV